MITLTNVWKTYASDLGATAQTALADFSFSLEAGMALGLIGANGAGKSTCIKLLMDFIRPDKGEIILFGQPPAVPASRRRIGYLPETANFPPNLTVLDMLRFTAATCNMSRTAMGERSENLLTRLGLWQARKRPLRTYSKGMQQRANFVIALLNDPELLILDEPMSGLDPIGRADISALILELKRQGKTILFCSHILEDVDRLVDAVLVLHRGRKLFDGSPAALLAQQQAANLPDAFLSLIKGAGNA